MIKYQFIDGSTVKCVPFFGLDPNNGDVLRVDVQVDIPTRVTIASELKKVGSMYVLEYAWTFFNSKDVFDKDSGKEIAFNRLVAKGEKYSFFIVDKPNCFRISKTMIENIHLDDSTPAKYIDLLSDKILYEYYDYPRYDVTAMVVDKISGLWNSVVLSLSPVVQKISNFF